MKKLTEGQQYDLARHAADEIHKSLMEQHSKGISLRRFLMVL